MFPTYHFIDSDTHVGEPPDLWSGRVASKDSEHVPMVVFNEERARYEWRIEGDFISVAPSGTVAGSKSLPPASPKSFEEAHPAAFDPVARLDLMDDMGAWAQVLFPNVGGFGNEAFMKIADASLRLQCVQIYNDYIAEWQSIAPERFVPVCATPFWDLDETVAEIRRCRETGHKAILFCGKPDIFWDQPHISDSHWDPVWSVAAELEMPVAFHIGSADQNTTVLTRGRPDMPKRTRFTMNTIPLFLGNAQTMVDLVFGGVLERHPDVRFVSVESGIGWIPFLLETMDYQFSEHRIRDVSPDLKLKPSEYFHRQVYSSFWFESSAPERLIDLIGEDHVMFETDFPHPTSLWPPESVRVRVDKVATTHNPKVREKLLWRNAAELYGLSFPTESTAAAGSVAVG